MCRSRSTILQTARSSPPCLPSPPWMAGNQIPTSLGRSFRSSDRTTSRRRCPTQHRIPLSSGRRRPAARSPLLSSACPRTPSLTGWAAHGHRCRVPSSLSLRPKIMLCRLSPHYRQCRVPPSLSSRLPRSAHRKKMPVHRRQSSMLPVRIPPSSPTRLVMMNFFTLENSRLGRTRPPLASLVLNHPLSCANRLNLPCRPARNGRR